MIPDSCKNIWFINNIDFVDFAHHARIPQVLHMIWVGDSEPPDTFQPHVDKWKQLMPHWSIRVWRNEDITDEHFSQQIIEKINTSTKGAQKADIMRYCIVEKYGGVYMDADVVPHRSLDPIIYDLNGAEIVMCHDIPLTWEYMSIGFFAAVAHHSVLKIASELVANATLNTENIHMHTGPQVLGWAMARDNINARKHVIIPSKYFYYNEGFDQRFGTHTYDKNW